VIPFVGYFIPFVGSTLVRRLHRSTRLPRKPHQCGAYIVVTLPGRRPQRRGTHPALLPRSDGTARRGHHAHALPDVLCRAAGERLVSERSALCAATFNGARRTPRPPRRTTCADVRHHARRAAGGGRGGGGWPPVPLGRGRCVGPILARKTTKNSARTGADPADDEG